MDTPCKQKSAREMLDMYFIENRARLLDIAAFMDRIDRYAGAAEARGDFRYRAFVQAVKTMLATEGGRAKAIQMIFSDTSAEPIESAVGLKALGAWEGAADEGH